MTYPAFMVCIGFIVLSFLFTFVIPKIVKIFENTQATLPLATVILIGISKLFLHFWWAILGLVMLLLWGIRKSQERYRFQMDRMKLKIPGQILQNPRKSITAIALDCEDADAIFICCTALRAAGIIERVGRSVSAWKPGDSVTFDSTLSCGACAFCRSGSGRDQGRVDQARMLAITSSGPLPSRWRAPRP